MTLIVLRKLNKDGDWGTLRMMKEFPSRQWKCNTLDN